MVADICVVSLDFLFFLVDLCLSGDLDVDDDLTHLRLVLHGLGLWLFDHDILLLQDVGGQFGSLTLLSI